MHSAHGGDVTIWLPSDFRGRIHRAGVGAGVPSSSSSASAPGSAAGPSMTPARRVSFSAGFTNTIMRNVSLTQSRRPSVVSVAPAAASEYRFSEKALPPLPYYSSNEKQSYLHPHAQPPSHAHPSHAQFPSQPPTQAHSGFGGDYGGFADYLAASAFAYQVTEPTNATGWTTAGSNVVAWDKVSTDPANFTIVLVNQVCTDSPMSARRLHPSDGHAPRMCPHPRAWSLPLSSTAASVNRM